MTCLGIPPLRGRSKTLRSPCSCCSENIFTMRTRIQNDIQSKSYSLSRCSKTASFTSTEWASKPLRISSNSLLQTAGDGAVEAARRGRGGTTSSRPVHFLHHVLRSFTCTFSSPCSAFIRFSVFLSLCLFDLQRLFLNHLTKSDKRGWLTR